MLKFNQERLIKTPKLAPRYEKGGELHYSPEIERIKPIKKNGKADLYEIEMKNTDRNSGKKFFLKDYPAHNKLHFENEIDFDVYSLFIGSYEYRSIGDNEYQVLFPFIEGEHIDELKIKKERRNERIWQILTQFILGMYDYYRKDFAHIDIKPDNIIFKKVKDTSVTRPVFIDFDVSKTGHSTGKEYDSFTPGWKPPYRGTENHKQILNDIWQIGWVCSLLFLDAKDRKKIQPSPNNVALHEFPHEIITQIDRDSCYGDKLLEILKKMISKNIVYRTPRDILADISKYLEKIDGMNNIILGLKQIPEHHRIKINIKPNSDRTSQREFDLDWEQTKVKDLTARDIRMKDPPIPLVSFYKVDKGWNFFILDETRVYSSTKSNTGAVTEDLLFYYKVMDEGFTKRFTISMLYFD